MKTLTNQQIEALHISPKTCVEWVRESFLTKPHAQLPVKISLHPQGNDFFNAMPCIFPTQDGELLYSVKIVHRIANTKPSLGSNLLLYNARNGELLAMMEADWITSMRTGAVATLAAQTFRKKGTSAYGILGLGETGRATILCLLESEPDIMHHIALLRYKDQAERFAEHFSAYLNAEFTIVDSMHELIQKSDVLFSCITDTNNLLCEDDSVYHPGILVIPVHSKGFQNCDLFFDKVFGDDRGHLHDFRYFNQFKQFAEMTDVLIGNTAGRENDEERILSYNIGLGLHDAVFASKIYKKLN